MRLQLAHAGLYVIVHWPGTEYFYIVDVYVTQPEIKFVFWDLSDGKMNWLETLKREKVAN